MKNSGSLFNFLKVLLPQALIQVLALAEVPVTNLKKVSLLPMLLRLDR